MLHIARKTTSPQSGHRACKPLFMMSGRMKMSCWRDCQLLPCFQTRGAAFCHVLSGRASRSRSGGVGLSFRTSRSVSLAEQLEEGSHGLFVRMDRQPCLVFGKRIFCPGRRALDRRKSLFVLFCLFISQSHFFESCRRADEDRPLNSQVPRKQTWCCKTSRNDDFN